jgi:L-rhamnose mutarotase
MKLYCLALDLKDNPTLIAEYKRYHQADMIWPEVIANIKSQGIIGEEIFLLGTRLVMVLRTTDDFDFESKATIDLANSKMREWEELMWNYQQPVPQAKPGQKWVLMEKIFEI